MPWVIDKRHSCVGFSVRHMGVATVHGAFSDYSGQIEFNPADLTHSWVSGEAAVASLYTHDPQRDAHLRSPEFFDAERFPTITFRSKRIEALGGNRFRADGDLTIRGQTREVAFEVTYAGDPRRDPGGVLRTGFSAATIINRSEFGLLWNVPLEGSGMLVGEQVQLQIDLELMKVEAGAATQAAPR